MKWVGPAFVSEGSTDDRFLPNVINRCIVDLCAKEFSDAVEVADTVVVRDRTGPAPVEAVVAELLRNAGSYNIVIAHHDGGASLERVEREWLTPLRGAWAEAEVSVPLVFVVPVRETEAWALADGNAIRRAYGVSWSDDRLGVPSNPRAVRDIEDPKKVFAAIRQATRGHRVDYHSRIGELISLDRLGHVDAFFEWRGKMKDVLEHDLRLTRQG